MSFFYLSAVKGDMSLHLLETIIIKRLDYLKAVIERNDTIYNEFVVEGSVYDNVGHFMVCVISILGGNTEFMQFVLKAEMKLFEKRLATLSAYDMQCFAKKLLRNIKRLEYTPHFIDALAILSQHLILKDVAHHITCPLHDNDCKKYKMNLNFKHCLSFVAKREIELKHGTALIPCGKWKKYLVTLFHNNLYERLQRSDMNILKSDPRLCELIEKITHNFFPNTHKASALLCKEVDSKSQSFPPCMLNLHRSLRSKHRLSHSQRFYYSLFLKDIGMPIEEAIQFWREEYRQTPSGHHSCCHNWEKDEKKYLYGIRHMYGLEGGRKNYTSVNCQRIQSSDNACTEGGCPFKSFDSARMLPLLGTLSEELVSRIDELKQKKLYTNACMLHLRTKSTDCDNFSFNFTPVKYYLFASGNNKSALNYYC